MQSVPSWKGGSNPGLAHPPIPSSSFVVSDSGPGFVPIRVTSDTPRALRQIEIKKKKVGCIKQT